MHAQVFSTHMMENNHIFLSKLQEKLKCFLTIYNYINREVKHDFHFQYHLEWFQVMSKGLIGGQLQSSAVLTNN